MDTYFSESEACKKIGAEVVAMENLPDVPVGTRGKVVKVVQGNERGWMPRIEWDLPPQRSEILAQLGDLSFNLPWRNKRSAEFTKGEAERLLRPFVAE